MAKLTINRGSFANDGTGDNLREGANKVNLNFDEIYTAIGDGNIVDGTVKFADDSSTVATISANGETLRILGGSGIDTTISGNDLTIATDATVLSASQVSTLTNKSIALGSNTITGTTAEFNTALTDNDFATLTGSETLTNKTINISSNSITGTALTITGDDSSAQSISIGDGLLFTGGSGITTSISGNEITFSTDGSIVTETSTDTLTNKSISLTNNTITGTTAEFNTALSDGSFATLAGTETLTNKTLSGSSNSIDITNSGNKIRFNFANVASFPNEVTYEGMFAYDIGGNEAYVADAGGWVKLLNENSSVSAHSDVNIVGVTDGQALIWSSAQGRFNPGTAGGYSAGTDLDLAGAIVQDAGYISHRSPDSTVTKTLTVTVASKTSEHYEFGSGSANGYVIDGDESPHLTLAPGVYKFDQSDATNATHPLKFYYDRDKNREMSTGVTIAGTPGSAGAHTTITIDRNTPSPLYYECTAHSYMGHSLNVTSGKQASLNITTATATGDLAGANSGKSFTILAGRSVNDILVFVNGICMVPTDDYTVSGNTLTFDTAPSTGAEIQIRYLG